MVDAALSKMTVSTLATIDSFMKRDYIFGIRFHIEFGPETDQARFML